MSIRAFLKNREEEMGLMRNMAIKALELWLDPQINITTSRSDFDVADFIKERSTLYITVHPSDIVRLRPLLQIFYQQCISAMTLESYKHNGDKIGMLMLLDEFNRLGNMDFIEIASTYSRGFKLKICSFINSIGALEDIYGHVEASSIINNHSVKIACCTNDPGTMNFISDIVGDKLVELSDGEKEESPLILPSEVARLNIMENIIVSDSIAIRAEKIKYYEDPEFSGRILEPAPIPALARE
jgi:type IV secretion system protein VirD4